MLGVTRRNAFRGGELLDLKIKGNYEWQTAHHGKGSSSKFNSYEYGADASLQLPRMVIPYVSYFRKKLFNHFQRIGFFSTPSTTLKFSTDILNRADSSSVASCRESGPITSRRRQQVSTSIPRCRSPMNI